tara:strand:- start:828 stop:1307 length:480 start_codon:yes stop_codon:yes gene_type:complete
MPYDYVCMSKDTDMPKSTVDRKKLFRSFSKIDKMFIKENYLNNITFLYRDAKHNYNLTRLEVDFIMFIYDLEFWTIKYVAEAMNRSETQMRKDFIWNIKKKGYIYKHFDKLTPSNKLEDHIFRDETKYNYAVRYALSQKGRLVVARLYRKMRGEEDFNF